MLQEAEVRKRGVAIEVCPISRWASPGTDLAGRVDQSRDKGNHLARPRLLRSFEELRVDVHSLCSRRDTDERANGE